jgi:hypothetical protein
MTELIAVPQTNQWSRLKALVLDSVSSPVTKRVYNLGLDEFFAGTARSRGRASPRRPWPPGALRWRAAASEPFPSATWMGLAFRCDRRRIKSLDLSTTSTRRDDGQRVYRLES